MTVQTFNFEADTGKILSIVINSLYSQKEIFLRELISNGSDAINKRKFDIMTAGNAADTFDGKITIAVNKKDKTITLSDNGIGLSPDEMVETLGTIASSGTKAFIEAAKTTKDTDDVSDQLIGQFGVGFYSSFMVADRVEVSTKKAGNKESWRWISDGETGFEIKKDVKKENGTSITLFLNDEGKEFASRWKIEGLIKKYSDHIDFPIFLTYSETDYDDEGKEKGKEIKTIKLTYSLQ